jgi:hypothetical protein
MKWHNDKYYNMIVSYGNESIGTIGDFATSWPLISQLSKIEGPIEITLNDRYKKGLSLLSVLYEQYHLVEQTSISILFYLQLYMSIQLSVEMLIKYINQ